MSSIRPLKSRLGVYCPKIESLERRHLLSAVSPLEANVSGYRVDELTLDDAIEHRLVFDDFHFGTLLEIEDESSVALRPRPDLFDPNGFGSTYFINPFIGGAEPRPAQGVESFSVDVQANATGIALTAEGPLLEGSNGSFGTWQISMNLQYDASAQQITSNATELSIQLEGDLSTAEGDLNLFRINSNFLDDVPLQRGGIGDTGDMQRVDVMYAPNGDPRDFTWIPSSGDTFPTDQSTFLSAQAIGETNVVDTIRTGDGFQIDIARKPTIRLSLQSNNPAVSMIFGAQYDETKAKRFEADNVGVLGLVLKDATDETSMSFDVDFESVPPPFPKTGADSLAARTSQQWWVARSTEAGFENERWGQWPAGGSWQDVQRGDFNGDGVQDFVGRNQDGALHVARSTGSTFLDQVWGQWASDVEWDDVLVGDYNGDGFSDIAGRTNGNWWIALSDGSRFSNERWGRWSPTANWGDVSVGDLNGDDLSDLVGRTRSGRWWVAVSDGAQFGNELFGRWSSTVNWQDVLIADFNADSRSDISGRLPNGQWWVSVSTGTRLINEPWGQWPSAVNWKDVAVGDFNNDGRFDIAGRRQSGQWWVAVSDGNSFDNQVWGRWASVLWRDVLVGDFNFDGRSDIVGRHPNGKQWVAFADGNQFDTQLWGRWSDIVNWEDTAVGRFTVPG